jgi:hypothetical protein
MPTPNPVMISLRPDACEGPGMRIDALADHGKALLRLLERTGDYTGDELYLAQLQDALEEAFG